VRATRLAKERSDLSNALDEHEESWLVMSAEYEEALTE
jgi:ATP-binding cassette subfamily F protein 3